MDDEDMEVFFKDITLQESDCEYEAVNALMDPDGILETWVVRSEFGITQGYIGSYGECEFWKNGDFVLSGYGSEFQTEYQPMPVDLMFLHAWLRSKGWRFVVDTFFRESAPDYWQMLDRLVKDDETTLEDYDYYQEDIVEEDSYDIPKKEMDITDIHEFKKLKTAYDKRKEKEKKIF